MQSKNLTFVAMINVNVFVRKGRVEDAPAAAQLIVQAMEETARRLVCTDDMSQVIKAFEYLYSQKNNLYSFENIVVLECEGEVAGIITTYDGGRLKELKKLAFDYFAKFGFDGNMQDETQAGELYIDTLSVSAKHQGKGYGQLLINHILKEAPHAGFSKVGLLVDVENPRAKKLYERLGFQTVGKKMLFEDHFEHMQYEVS